MADYQVEYRGLTMGLGTDFSIVSLTGLEADEVRLGDTQIPRAGGDIPGLHVPSARFIEMEVVAGGEKDSQAHRDNVQALVDAFQHSDTTHKFYFEEPGMGGRRYVNARPAGRFSNRDPRWPFFAKHTVRLKVADPRTYEEFQNTGQVSNYDATGGGTDYDVTEYGKEFTVDSSAQTIVRNNGNTKAWPILKFYGPISGTITQLTLTNITSGQPATVFDSTLLTGQILTADMEAVVTVKPSGLFVVRLEPNTNRYSEWAQPRDPFYLVPGDNTLRFEITGGTSTDGICTVTYRDTWL